MWKGIGVNIDTRRINGSIRRFRDELEFFTAIGFDYVEIPLAGLDVVVRGRIIEKRMQRLLDILNEFNIKRTVHAPDVINLKHKTNPWHYKVFEATLAFAHRVGAEVVVYHCGTVDHTLDMRQRDQIRAEIQALKRLGKTAQDLGIVIGVENLFQPATEVAKLVMEVNHPNVRMTLDFGHLFIYCQYTGTDFYKEIERALPAAVELHVSDNFAEAPYTYQDIPDNEPYRFVYGIGDLHLPIGEGDMPYGRILPLVRKHRFNGIVVLEVNSMDRFKEDYADSLKLLRRYMNSGNGRRVEK